MRTILLFTFIFFFLFFSCGKYRESDDAESNRQLTTGIWRGVIKTQGIEIPFLFDVEKDNGNYTVQLINGAERIPLDEVIVSGDSVHIPLYVFDATIHAKILDQKMTGVWIKNYADDYIIPFEASYGKDYRFEVHETGKNADFEGKWEVDFTADDDVEKAIGVFRQDGNKATGTFLTTTGDYRFLEGVVDGDSMKLSCFDGSHAYLFYAVLNENGTIQGEFWSGKSWNQQWTGKRNEDFELPDPYAVTYIKDGYDSFGFIFPNTDGDSISLSDEQYKNKVTIVQLLGSWCPNCMDETRFFTEWKRKNPDKEVEFVGLAFEAKDDFEYAAKRINNLKNKLGVNYEILIAGNTSTESKEAALPMLNKIMSFPTSIILDRQHNVRKIHTGFSGPGTGDYFDKYKEEFELTIDKLLSEPTSK